MQDFERVSELALEVENLIAFLLVIEDLPGCIQYLDERGFTEEDLQHLKYFSHKLLSAFMPKRMAS